MACLPASEAPADQVEGKHTEGEPPGRETDFLNIAATPEVFLQGLYRIPLSMLDYSPIIRRQQGAPGLPWQDEPQRESCAMSDVTGSDFLSIADIFSYDQNFQDVMLNMLQSALEASFQGVMITEAEPGFPIIYVNPAVCEMTGYSRRELLGQSPAMLQGEKTDPAVLADLREKIDRGEIFHGKTYNYRKDGSTFMMEWKIVPIRGAGGEIANYLAIQREVVDDQ
jgi:PAS domain S-box-containing protein